MLNYHETGGNYAHRRHYRRRDDKAMLQEAEVFRESGTDQRGYTHIP